MEESLKVMITPSDKDTLEMQAGSVFGQACRVNMQCCQLFGTAQSGAATKAYLLYSPACYTAKAVTSDIFLDYRLHGSLNAIYLIKAGYADIISIRLVC